MSKMSAYNAWFTLRHRLANEAMCCVTMLMCTHIHEWMHVAEKGRKRTEDGKWLKNHNFRALRGKRV